MAKMVLLITTHVDKSLDIAEAWEALGAPGVTLIESHGLHRIREQSQSLEINLFVSMTRLLRQIEDTNQVIMSVVEDHLVDALVQAACDVIGAKSLDEERVGVAFVIDVERVIGMRVSKPNPSKER